MARPSAKGMEVPLLVALLTQPPAQHMHIHAYMALQKITKPVKPL